MYKIFVLAMVVISTGGNGFKDRSKSVLATSVGEEVVTLKPSASKNAADTLSSSSSSSSSPEEARQYGGGEGGYGGMGYGAGPISCPACPAHYPCDGKLDGLLAFGVGSLLGLLLAALRNQMTTMMMAAATPPPPPPMPMPPMMMMPSMMMPPMMMGRRRGGSAGVAEKFVDGVSVDEKGSRRRSSLLEMLHLPEDIGDHLAPALADALRMFTSSSAEACLERWLCELYRQGGMQAKIASFTRVLFGWYTKGWRQSAQNGNGTLYGGLEACEDSGIECIALSPTCNVSSADFNGGRSDGKARVDA